MSMTAMFTPNTVYQKPTPLTNNNGWGTSIWE